MIVDHRLDNSPKGTKYSPDGLLDDWKTFLELLKLKKDFKICLEVPDADRNNRDLFDLSYRKLVETQGKPSEHIRENESFKTWITNIDFLENDEAARVH